jgi:hypothetical protein
MVCLWCSNVGVVEVTLSGLEVVLGGMLESAEMGEGDRGGEVEAVRLVDKIITLQNCQF